jgi:SAM-dependent methyltransferase
MEAFKFTTVAHTDHLICSPVGPHRVDQLIELLELAPSQRVLDIGCGKAGMLIRIVERFGAFGVGVDPNPAFLAAAREAASGRVLAGALDLRLGRAADQPFAPASFDAVLCIGASQALGGYRAILGKTAELLRPGGRILVGEGYWKRSPAPEYLAFLGAGPEDYTDHAGNVRLGEGEGYVPLYSATSSDEEWDHYEGLYCRAVERYARNNPDDPDGPAMVARIRMWRNAYLRWGRDTLGFGLYLFQKPS